MEIRKIVAEVHAGAAEEPDLLNVLAGRPGRAGECAEQDGKRQSSS
jgi:hypothetical protein